MHSDYAGDEKLTVGNGMPLSITYSGYILPAAHSSLRLANVLLSISKFTKDNNVFVEFHPNCCLVKNIQG